MNYLRIYEALIASARAKPFLGYTERHHVMPRCLGGGNEPNNLVRLSARHHFIAHLLLAKIHGGRLVYAAWSMQNDGKHTSRKYAWLRSKISKAMLNNKHGLILNGRKKSPEMRKKMQGNSNAKGNKFKQSASAIEKLSRAMIGNQNTKGKKMPPRTPEHMAKIIESRRKSKKMREAA